MDLVKPDGGADEPANDAAREPEAPPTAYEHVLVRHAGDVVAREAKKLAKKFPRLIHDEGLMSIGDLMSIGQVALYRAARLFSDDYNSDFKSYGRHYARFAMLDVVDDLLFEERVKRAAAQAEDNYCGYFRDREYNVMKHDEAEARRRYRAFANGLLAATLTAGLHEAAQRLDMAEIAERIDYERALALVGPAFAKFTEADRRMFELMYRDLMDLKTASETLGVPYGTARARHARALARLHDLLVEQGIARAPRPLVVPDGGPLFAPAENDTGPGGHG
jgi:RNA polymerase sigma factor (sigma-70 family)